MRNPKGSKANSNKKKSTKVPVSSEKSTTKRQTDIFNRPKVSLEKSPEIEAKIKQKNADKIKTEPLVVEKVSENENNDSKKSEVKTITHDCEDNKDKKCVQNSEECHKITNDLLNLNVNDDVKDCIHKKGKKKQQIQDDGKLNKDSSGSNNSRRPQTRNQKPNTPNKNEEKNHKITDYFKYRRSARNKKNGYDELQKDIENRIENQIEDGLEVKEFEEKGRGVVTTKNFYKGQFVVEYIGDLIDGATAKLREITYAKKKNIGCYMYYFRHKDIRYCIDATEESGKLGRLINHSRKGNLYSKVIEVNQTPHIILFAKMDIPSGTEILYDYGDRNQASIQNHPWLAL